MEVVFKNSQISQISEHLGITKVSVNNILTEYIKRLREKLESGETVKFLNVCYLRVGDSCSVAKETLAYISAEIGEVVGQSSTVVYRVLTTYEDLLIRDLRKLNTYSIRGVVRIKLEKNYKGEYKVRTKKSTAYNGFDVYVTTLPSFKRRVEVGV